MRTNKALHSCRSYLPETLVTQNKILNFKFTPTKLSTWSCLILPLENSKKITLQRAGYEEISVSRWFLSLLDKWNKIIQSTARSVIKFIAKWLYVIANNEEQESAIHFER